MGKPYSRRWIWVSIPSERAAIRGVSRNPANRTEGSSETH
jgi:hypothetical protein